MEHFTYLKLLKMYMTPPVVSLFLIGPILIPVVSIKISLILISFVEYQLPFAIRESSFTSMYPLLVRSLFDHGH
jgi:hypothetical protein